MNKEEIKAESTDLEKAVDEVIEEFSKSESEDVQEKVAKSKEDKVVKADKEDMEMDEKEEDEKEDKKEMKKEEKKEDMKHLEENSMKYKSLSDEEYAEYLDLKKAKEEEAEILAKSEHFEELKKAVSEETEGKFDKIGEIMKSFLDKVETIESKLDEIGSQASRVRKSAKSVATIEKSFSAEEGEKKPALNKAQVLNALTELCKSDKIAVEDVTIFETSGHLTPNAKKAIEGK